MKLFITHLIATLYTQNLKAILGFVLLCHSYSKIGLILLRPNAHGIAIYGFFIQNIHIINFINPTRELFDIPGQPIAYI